MIFRVDFNNIGESPNIVKGSLRNASSQRVPDLGEQVYLHDFEGNACFGRVLRIADPVITFEIKEQ